MRKGSWGKEAYRWGGEELRMMEKRKGRTEEMKEEVDKG